MLYIILSVLKQAHFHPTMLPAGAALHLFLLSLVLERRVGRAPSDSWSSLATLTFPAVNFPALPPLIINLISTIHEGRNACKLKAAPPRIPAAWNPLIWLFLNLHSTFSFPDRSPDEKSRQSLASLASAQIAGAGFYMMAVIK